MALRDLMAVLRFLAKNPRLNGNRLPAAEMQINEYIRSLQRSVRQSTLTILRDAFTAEAEARPEESEFWETVEEYVSTLKP